MGGYNGGNGGSAPGGGNGGHNGGGSAPGGGNGGYGGGGDQYGDYEKDRMRRDNSGSYFDTSIIGFHTFEMDGFASVRGVDEQVPIAIIGTACFDGREGSKQGTLSCTIEANGQFLDTDLSTPTTPGVADASGRGGDRERDDMQAGSFRLASRKCEFTVARDGEGVIKAVVTSSDLGERISTPIVIRFRAVSENKAVVLMNAEISRRRYGGGSGDAPVLVQAQTSGFALRNFRLFDPFNIRGGEKRHNEYSSGTLMKHGRGDRTGPSSSDFTCPAVSLDAPRFTEGDSDRSIGYDRFDDASGRNEASHNSKGNGGPGAMGSSGGCCSASDSPFDADHMY
jgi:hypothetical protein